MKSALIGNGSCFLSKRELTFTSFSFSSSSSSSSFPDQLIGFLINQRRATQKLREVNIVEVGQVANVQQMN